tara:strand:- start:2163 stop:2906 length:744 start_codon:yes stop_codon:yes gene_type:complete
MKLLTTALLAATAFAVVAPAASAQSQAYGNCESERQGRQVAGAIIGGILGAVIGNELADDSNNQPTYRRGGRGHHRGYRGRSVRNDRGNAEEVGTIAGAGVGALIGAGIAGGDDCGSYSNNSGYNAYPGKPGSAGYDQTYYQGQNTNSGYGDNYGGNYDAGYGNGYDSGYGSDYGYVDGSGSTSSTQLLGGAQAGQDARVYNTGAQDWNCQWTSSRRMGEYGQTVTEQVYMCQGADNIWRPYDTYTQ